MQTITINRKKVRVSAADRRVVRALVISGGIACLSHFEIGRGRSQRNEARDVATEYRTNDCGVRIYWRHSQYLWRHNQFWQNSDTPKRVAEWFNKNPRNQYCVSGDLKRIRKVWREVRGELELPIL